MILVYHLDYIKMILICSVILGYRDKNLLFYNNQYICFLKHSILFAWKIHCIQHLELYFSVNFIKIHDAVRLKIISYKNQNVYSRQNKISLNKLYVWILYCNLAKTLHNLIGSIPGVEKSMPCCHPKTYIHTKLSLSMPCSCLYHKGRILKRRQHNFCNANAYIHTMQSHNVTIKEKITRQNSVHFIYVLHMYISYVILKSRRYRKTQQNLTHLLYHIQFNFLSFT